MPVFRFTTVPQRMCVYDNPVFIQDSEQLNCPCALQPIKWYLNDDPEPIDEPKLIDEA